MKKIMSLLLVVCFAFLGINAHAKNALPFNPPLTIASDTTALIEYKGIYKFEEGAPVSKVTIVIEKEELWAESAQGSFVLKPVDKQPDNFTIAEIEAEVVFKRNADKKIIGISVKMPDGTIVAEKEKSK